MGHPLGILLASGHCCTHALFFLFHYGGDALLVGCGWEIACLIRSKHNHKISSTDWWLRRAVLRTFPIGIPLEQPSPVEYMYAYESSNIVVVPTDLGTAQNTIVSLDPQNTFWLVAESCCLSSARALLSAVVCCARHGDQRAFTLFK